MGLGIQIVPIIYNKTIKLLKLLVLLGLVFRLLVIIVQVLVITLQFPQALDLDALYIRTNALLETISKCPVAQQVDSFVDAAVDAGYMCLELQSASVK